MALWDDHSALPDQDLLAELEALRVRRRLTKGEFAGLMRVSPQYWSNVLHGHRALSRTLLDRLNVVAPGAFDRYYRRQRQRATAPSAPVEATV